jgi:hypothetical protein
MTRLTTQQHHEVPGGTLRVTVETDHTLSPAELEGLADIASACRAFGAPAGRHHGAVEFEASAEVDVAIWELGGDQGISAG